jgi:hypothetical protein
MTLKLLARFSRIDVDKGGTSVTTSNSLNLAMERINW